MEFSLSVKPQPRHNLEMSVTQRGAHSLEMPVTQRGVHMTTTGLKTGHVLRAGGWVSDPGAWRACTKSQWLGV